jgi:hypothetical protein
MAHSRRVIVIYLLVRALVLSRVRHLEALRLPLGLVTVGGVG